MVTILDDTIGKKMSFYWLVKGDLVLESKGFILAEQEQSISTRAMCHIYDTGTSSMCMLCSEHPETVEHLVCGCNYLAGLQYKRRLDEVAKYLHQLLCGKYELECDAVWRRYSPHISVQE